MIIINYTRCFNYHCNCNISLCHSFLLTLKPRLTVYNNPLRFLWKFVVNNLVPGNPANVWSALGLWTTLGSLSNHVDDGNKNPTNLHIWQWKTVFLHALTCIFHVLTFWRRSRSFYDVKWPVLQLCGRREHMKTNVNFCLFMSQALVPI